MFLKLLKYYYIVEVEKSGFMKCINCDANLGDDATYCMRCGSFQSANPTQVSNNQNMTGQPQLQVYPNASNTIMNQIANASPSDSIDTNKLSEAYIGKKYNRFFYSSFSWGYLFLGPLYAFCRRMYSFGLTNILIAFLIGLIFTIFPNATTTGVNVVNIIEFIIILIVQIYFSFKFKGKYVETVDQRVKKMAKDNPNLDMVMLQEKCRRGGGLNIFWVIVSIYVSLQIIISIIIVLVWYITASEKIGMPPIPPIENPAVTQYYPNNEIHYNWEGK